jgi:hypothetical protein
MATQILTQERLKELLRYDPDTGVFTWRITRRNAKQGAVAGTVSLKGYRYVSVDSKLYGAHRLAWFYQTGCWPLDELDHINRHRDDNRIANLREASRIINCQNTSLRKDSRTGHRGVGWHKATGRWRARLQAHGKMLELGYFDDLEHAVAAYKTAAQIHHAARAT